MLSNEEIKSLSQFLIEDTKALNLSREQFPERVNWYLENIAGFEFISEEQHQNLIQKILDQAKINQSQI